MEQEFQATVYLTGNLFTHVLGSGIDLSKTLERLKFRFIKKAIRSLMEGYWIKLLSRDLRDRMDD